ncbi:MAG: type II toxin-antitoxin system VapC family toxin [Anaerolineae bacterium]|nr:type II toxin-antitoxin system VapC family toxin [Anaerolineae bacterium]MCI0607943.1 type II toxin-antitoxin system VapC family toxin [Anaerolineae bacterium]
MFIVVDASIWVARLVSEDVFYEPVKQWMSARIENDDEFLAPSLLLAEIGGAISRRTTPSLGLKAIEQLQSLPGLQLVEMEHSLLREAAQLAAELALRGADSTYVAVAARLDIPLITLDVDQREKAARRVKVLEIST